jgi:lysozyme
MNIGLAVEVAAALCRRFEGCCLSPYLCPAGIPTIGYGATYYEDGYPVTLHDYPITKEQAEKLLLWMVTTQYLPAVIKLCPSIDNPNRLAAIIDFAYNLGSKQLSNSNLRRKINAGRWDDVPAELKKWVRGGGKVLNGLTLRREAEASLV